MQARLGLLLGRACRLCVIHWLKSILLKSDAFLISVGVPLQIVLRGFSSPGKLSISEGLQIFIWSIIHLKEIYLATPKGAKIYFGGALTLAY